MKKYFARLLLVFSMICVNAMPLNAHNKDQIQSLPMNAIITIKNKETGEIYNEFREITIPLSKKADNRGNEYFVNFQTFIELPLINSEIMPFNSSGTDLTEAGVEAYVTVYYDLDSTGNLIKIKSTSGGWIPSNQMYIVSNRRVILRENATGNELNRTPSSNAFSYTTGWGFVERYYDTYGPSVATIADIEVAGMSGTGHEISIFFTF